MIDAAAPWESDAAGRDGHGRSTAQLSYDVVGAASAGALSTYQELCRHAIYAPAQSPEWVRNWVKHLQPDGLVASISCNEQPVFALALEIRPVGPFRIARFMGGSHANGNFPALAPGWKGDLPAMRSLIAALASARPEIDAVVLARIAPELEGQANPLLLLPHVQSPNIALSVDLRAGFDAVLGQAGARSKRKRHRAETRKLEAAGGFRRIEAKTVDQAQRLLDSFLDMKEKRFRAMGVANVFADERIQAFFHALFADALHAETPPFTLEGLEVGGKLRAVTGTSRCGARLTCEFGAIYDDELGTSSPGEFLFNENIEQACGAGDEVYDFGVGDEPYKRLWCDIETHHADVIVPFSTKGRIYASGLKAAARLEAALKNNPPAWLLAKSLRKRLAAWTG